MSLFSARLTPARVAFNLSAKLGKRLLFGVLFTGLWVLSPTLSGSQSSGAAYAQGRGDRDVEKVVKLRILGSRSEKPASETAQGTAANRFETEKAAEFTQLAARGIRKRLKAAGIKDFSVTTPKSRTILVRVRGSVAREVITGIVVPRGRLELRPVEPAGARWVRASGDLPDGVELRQQEGSLDAAQAYLWSAEVDTLRAALASLEKTTLINGIPPADALDIKIYPADGGWRTLALNSPIATHKDVAGAAIHQGKTGESYVQLLFQNDLSDALKANDTLSADANLWAVLLDGEVVSVLSNRAHNLGSSLNIKAPEQLRTRKARQAWAQQVAGRLAAYIPVPLIEDGMTTPAK